MLLCIYDIEEIRFKYSKSKELWHKPVLFYRRNCL